MAHTNRALQVFLCYASADRSAVSAVYKRLIADGVKVWLDEESILPGQNWQAEIPNAVRNSDVVIVFLSKNSVNKEGYVQKEIKLALDIADEKPEGTIFIIPALIEECSVPSLLSIYQWVNLSSDKGYEKLKKALVVRAKSIGITLRPRKPARIPPQPIATKTQSVRPDRLVTNREYLIFVQSTNHRRPHNWNPIKPYFPEDQNEYPVTAISWDDAVAYCDWAGGNLPARSTEPLSSKSVLPKNALPIREWRNLGDEYQKQIYDPFAAHLIARADHAKPLENVGFRCIPVPPRSARNWVFLSGGSYLLGTNSERFKLLADYYRLDAVLRRAIFARQVRSYRVSDFTISTTCVTNEEYFGFTQVSGKRWPHHWHAKWLNYSDRPFPARLTSHPVTNITADDAQAYCIWSRTRLPTCFEWERAVSGQDKQPYPWGEKYDVVHVNSFESENGTLVAVDEYPRGDSPDGVRQLCGNVFEWVIDPDGRFEIRGGSYRVACELWGLAYAFRQVPHDFSAPDVGFRVVHD